MISTRSWARPSSAGSRVTELIIVSSTVAAAPRPRPETIRMPMSSMPSSEITTVIPANTTARPAVPAAASIAARGGRPSWTPAR